MLNLKTFQFEDVLHFLRLLTEVLQSVNEEVTAVHFDLRVHALEVHLLNLQVIVMQMKVGTEIVYNILIIGEMSLTEEDCVEVELLDERRTVVVLIEQRVDDELIVGHAVAFLFPGIDLEVDKLTGIEHQMMVQQWPDIVGHHYTTGIEERIILLVIDGQSVQYDLVLPVHFHLTADLHTCPELIAENRRQRLVDRQSHQIEVDCQIEGHEQQHHRIDDGVQAASYDGRDEFQDLFYRIYSIFGADSAESFEVLLPGGTDLLFCHAGF